MIDRQSGDHGPNNGRYPASVCRWFFDKIASADRLAIVGRLTPDDRATFCRYHDENFFKTSADHRAMIARRFTDDKTNENRRIGQRNF